MADPRPAVRILAGCLNGFIPVSRRRLLACIYPSAPPAPPAKAGGPTSFSGKAMPTPARHQRIVSFPNPAGGPPLAGLRSMTAAEVAAALGVDACRLISAVPRIITARDLDRNAIPPEICALPVTFLRANLGPFPTELGAMTALVHLRVNALPQFQLAPRASCGPLPSELGLCAALETVQVFCCVDGPIPPELAQCVRLRELILVGCGLTGGIPPELGGCPALEHLDLGSGGLTGAIPSELTRCARLGVIVLSDNALTGPIPTELGLLGGSLTRLVARNNRLSGPVPSELGRCGALQCLRLSHNFLAGAVPSELGLCGRLRALDLGTNALSGRIPPELARGARLHSLRLGANPGLTGPPPPGFRRRAGKPGAYVRD